MKHSLIYQAINSLRSGANFSIDDQDSAKVVFADGKTTVPSDEDLQTEISRLEARQVIINKIMELEALETPRRLAESILTDEGKAWLTSNRDKIATERGKL